MQLSSRVQEFCFLYLNSNHKVIEYRFADWINQIAFGSRTGGGGIPTTEWANGAVFSPASFPDTDAVVREQLDGVLHWSSVSFAVKKKFEKQIVSDSATINMEDVSANETFNRLAETLRKRSRFSES